MTSACSLTLYLLFSLFFKFYFSAYVLSILTAPLALYLRLILLCASKLQILDFYLPLVSRVSILSSLNHHIAYGFIISRHIPHDLGLHATKNTFFCHFFTV